MYALAFLIANDTVSPQSSNDLCKYCFIKLISYLLPLKDKTGNAKYQLSNWDFNDVAAFILHSYILNSFCCFSLYFLGSGFFSINSS